MTTLKLFVVKDTCLDREVFRGSAPANDIVNASWIDFHDLDRNRYGYQRPFDDDRSKSAAEYSITQGAFWPECILSIRYDPEEEEERIPWEFIPVSPDGRYGKLVVTYDESRTETITDAGVVPWRRAFSQVDCQHRLGSMSESNKSVTFCIFPDLSRIQEAVIFRTINANQKRVSTSLVDLIIYLTDQNHPDHTYIKWAFDLGDDSGSPFNRLVSTGGRNADPPPRLVNLRTLKECAASIITRPRLAQIEDEYGYIFLRNFWTFIERQWPTEFQDPREYKLMTVPGLKALSRFARQVFVDGLGTQDNRRVWIARAFPGGAAGFDWSSNGPLREASGNAGIRIIFEALKRTYRP